MWSCPRSRSTLVARSFDQLAGCVVYDEPLYAPYLLKHGLDHPQRDLVLAHRETDWRQVVRAMTDALPAGATFSFQKQMAKHILPEYDRDWLNLLHSFILIREPGAIIRSYARVCSQVTPEEIGMAALWELFQHLSSSTGRIPLVVDSKDLINDPRRFLPAICGKLGVEFSGAMLSWEPGLANHTKTTRSPFPMLWTGDLPPTAWYSQITQSYQFQPHTEETPFELSEALRAVYEECLPFYNSLCRYRIVLDP
jgi:hypothetical protein